MIEKCNPSHVDKIADRIAGAIVDLAYAKEDNPKIAVEVLIGHGRCLIISESTVELNPDDVFKAVERIAGQPVRTELLQTKQDIHLTENQADGFRCGDNGIFKGVPLTQEQRQLSKIAHDIYEYFPYDGKYIMDGIRLIICQSNADSDLIRDVYSDSYYQGVYGFEQTVGVATTFIRLDTAAIERVLLKPWAADGLAFSERI